jgi:PAS domain S-box-containing protein
VETSADGVLIYDRTGKILDSNSSYCQISGYDKQELLDLNLSDLKISDKTLESIDQLSFLTEESKINFETEHKTKSGKTIAFAVNASYLDSSGNCILAFYHDINSH